MFHGVENCWSCFGNLTSRGGKNFGSLAVRLSDAIVLPCCSSCWLSMTISERLAMAHRYAELFLTQNTRNQTVETLQSIENLFRSALDDFQKRSGREPWEKDPDEDDE